jgi:hypothetical protein
MQYGSLFIYKLKGCVGETPLFPNGHLLKNITPNRIDRIFLFLNSLSWHGLALKEVLKHYQCLPWAVHGNLMASASDGHQCEALIYLAPTADLIKKPTTEALVNYARDI